jgi:anti-sigma factor RsiW
MTDRPSITCRELIDFIMDYLDGTLPADRRLEFERHLGVCPSCIAYLDSYKAAVHLGQQALAPSDEPAAGKAPEDLLRAIRAALPKNT